MRQTRLLMGMPVSLELVDAQATLEDLEEAYTYLTYVDETFSTYKDSSEISRINAGLIRSEQYSPDMRYVLEQCKQTTQETCGYFNISHQGMVDPSGYVKGWAIQNTAQLLAERGLRNYYVEAGGDLQVSGLNINGQPWIIGIRNPFDREQIVKRLCLRDAGMATSGTYIRGEHIYNPHLPLKAKSDIVSLTVIGPAVVDADRYATAAFAMDRSGISFIASLPGFEGYMIDSEGIATFTPGFASYILS